MEPPNGHLSDERVPSAFYREFLTLTAEVQYLKAEFAHWRAKENEPKPTDAGPKSRGDKSTGRKPRK
jgi:hypothetical protein